ncbi:MAG: cobalamin-dependent protein [Desulfobacterales bacterium]|nr:cobalamin-dependent protein [Desulfobacterales bacterium]
MKILLISVNRERMPYPVAPIGALYIVSAVKKAGHEVDFLDMAFVKFALRVIKSKLKSASYDVIALSIRNLDDCSFCNRKSYVENTKNIVDAIRRWSDAPLVLGGSGFSVSPKQWLENLKAPYGVVGEGEHAFIQLLDRLTAGKTPEGIPGVVSSDRGSVYQPPDFLSDMSVRDVSFPAHERCEYRRYQKYGGFVSIQSKRGCPFKCIYCVYSALEGTAYRLRPPVEVVDEITQIQGDQKSDCFFFTDSVFNSPCTHAMDICQEIIRRNLKIKWMAYCNPVGFDAQLAKAMIQSGCVGVEFGLDSAVDKMLDALGKPFNERDIITCFDAANQNKLPFAVHLLFGGPGETLDDIYQAQQILNNCAPAKAVFGSVGIRIYENTAIAEIALNEGIINQQTNFFEPVYYLAESLGSEPVTAIDAIARERYEWTTPVDWNKRSMQLIQKLINRWGSHPQWLNIRNYGKHMRR